MESRPVTKKNAPNSYIGATIRSQLTFHSAPTQQQDDHRPNNISVSELALTFWSDSDHRATWKKKAQLKVAKITETLAQADFNPYASVNTHHHKQSLFAAKKQETRPSTIYRYEYLAIRRTRLWRQTCQRFEILTASAWFMQRWLKLLKTGLGRL